MQAIPPFSAYRSLHSGRTRGLTTWDDENDVCWLVAFSETHASGEDRDCYKYFESLSGRRLLAPTADDYEALWEVSVEAVLDGLVGLSGQLYAEARARPGFEASRSFSDGRALMMVDVVVIDSDQGEEGWVAVTIPQTIPHAEDVVIDYLARLVPPHVDIGTVQRSHMFGQRHCEYYELALTWTVYPAEVNSES